jgi:hypothetical protein
VQKLLKSEPIGFELLPFRLEEKQSGMAHKPSRNYRFDQERYEKNKSENYTFNF